MGLFDSFKQKLNIGGVKIQLTTPDGIDDNQTAVPVTVTLTASSQQEIKKVWVELTREYQQNRVGVSVGDTNQQDYRHPNELLEHVENTEAFTMMPGETKTMQFSLPHTSMSEAMQGVPGAEAAEALLSTLGKVTNAMSAMSGASYHYYIKAYADVGGAIVDAGATTEVHMTHSGPGNGAVTN